jgi:hypothetical protein
MLTAAAKVVQQTLDHQDKTVVQVAAAQHQMVLVEV